VPRCSRSQRPIDEVGTEVFFDQLYPQRTEDAIQKIRDKGLAAQLAAGAVGLAAQLAAIDKNEAAEKATGKDKFDRGTISEKQYQDALTAITESAAQQRYAKETGLGTEEVEDDWRP
jgi:endo-1,4-beta-D-glucanase Y